MFQSDVDIIVASAVCVGDEYLTKRQPTRSSAKNTMRFLQLSPALVLLLASTVDALRLGGGCSMSSRRAAIAGAVACTMPAAAQASVSKLNALEFLCLPACLLPNIRAREWFPTPYHALLKEHAFTIAHDAVLSHRRCDPSLFLTMAAAASMEREMVVQRSPMATSSS